MWGCEIPEGWTMSLESWDFNDLLRSPEEIVAAQRENLERVQEMERGSAR
jgi:hypothetical protein